MEEGENTSSSAGVRNVTQGEWRIASRAVGQQEVCVWISVVTDFLPLPPDLTTRGDVVRLCEEILLLNSI